MQQNKKLPFLDYKNYFENKILNYCDEHIGEKVLFPLFVNFWLEENCHLDKKNLVIITSDILKSLVEKNVLEEISVEESVRNKEFENGYTLYEILKHRKLVYTNKKFKRL